MAAERPPETCDLDVHPLMQGIEGLRTWMVFFHAAPVDTLVRVSAIVGLDPETYDETRRGLLLQLGQDDPLRAVIDLEDAHIFLDEYQHSIRLAHRISNVMLRPQVDTKRLQLKLVDALRLGAAITLGIYINHSNCHGERKNDQPGVTELLESVGGISFEENAFRFIKESTGDVDPRKWARH